MHTDRLTACLTTTLTIQYATTGLQCASRTQQRPGGQRQVGSGSCEECSPRSPLSLVSYPAGTCRTPPPRRVPSGAICRGDPPCQLPPVILMDSLPNQEREPEPSSRLVPRIDLALHGFLSHSLTKA
ncbi:hypothetical protein K474DRAFT_1514077 [Panus rudis PR-1116 ss-1]|nr:hypothetical protein K474DRAFT_1514077 [Panus rudis PR-1116 ss-1]